jgi:hypothetical protein
VIGVSLFAGGCTVVEGAIAYAVAGALMWVFAKKTFYDEAEQGDGAAPSTGSKPD